MKRIDTNTATSDRFIDRRVNPTSLAPCSAAAIGAMPSSTCREMFSSTTMASSTTRPVATISAISDRLLSEKPHRYITAQLPTSATGTAVTGIIAARKLARNSSTTKTTRATAMSSVRCASCSVARMVGDRSLATSSDTPAGRKARRAGSCSITPSTVAMMLACGWRLTTSSTAFSLLK